jgi:tetratricopeptide (TPR) repeat protein
MISVVIAVNAYPQSQFGSKSQLQAQFDSIRNISRTCFLEGKLDSMVKADNRLLALSEKIKEDSTFSWAYNLIGNYFAARANYSQALEYYLKGIQVSEKSAPSHLSFEYANIGGVYAALRNYAMALRYFYKGQQFLSADQLDGKIYLPLSLASVYNDLNKPDSALKYLQVANRLNLKEANYSDILRKGAYNLMEDNIYRNLGRLYEELHKPDLVNYYYKKGIRFSDSTRLMRSLAVICNDYSSYLAKQQKYTDAKNYAVLSFRISQKSGFKKIVVDAADQLYNLHRDHGQADSAYYYLSVKNLYQDSLITEQETNQLQALIINQQLHEAEQSAQAEADKEHHKRDIQYVLIASGIIVLLILFMLLNSAFVVKAIVIETIGVVGVLIVFEFINLIMHPFLAHITDDSPILMLLILVVIGAVAVPLHHKLEKWVRKRVAARNEAIRVATAKMTKAKSEKRSGKSDV